MNNLREAHRRLAVACSDRNWRDDPEDPDKPETIQAMQIALNLPKQDPPTRTEVLEAAARGVVKLCLDDRAGQDGAFAEALGQWYGHRIRKVARRARNKAWRDVQALPGVTVEDRARVFVPSAVQDVHPLVAKLQIGHTDLPQDDPGPALADAPVIYIDASLTMSAGKAAAQVGHGSMLLAAAMSVEQVETWAAQDFALSVREIAPADFAAACTRPDAVVVHDAGFTEVAPDSATVCALPRP
ncbi:peptidyl-tRNA hydrolase [Corynebacterium sp. HMSC034H07]|uniref:peptidyl-tRNA hydrolase n=1 Tax=Corynebacterium sp. HMSC034H07 TaxID=1739512 RepID=UPI0008A1DCCE|nr:peptidyl-tRNA hydrolase [Corynebacterium sp. HMSC034H07]OFO95642.1 ACR protein [Corynebacterium sp. HMSC034H07]